MYVRMYVSRQSTVNDSYQFCLPLSLSLYKVLFQPTYLRRYVCIPHKDIYYVHTYVRIYSNGLPHQGCISCERPKPNVPKWRLEAKDAQGLLLSQWWEAEGDSKKDHQIA